MVDEPCRPSARRSRARLCRAGADVELLVGGVGPAAVAAATARALDGVDLVLSAGIGGGFGALAAGDVAVASTIVFADLGAETADGFVPLSELGFGTERYEVAPKLAVELADRTGGHLGTVLTVATVTGTAATATALAERFPDAVAEGDGGRRRGRGRGAAAACRSASSARSATRSGRAIATPGRSRWRSQSLGRAVAAALA